MSIEQIDKKLECISLQIDELSQCDPKQLPGYLKVIKLNILAVRDDIHQAGDSGILKNIPLVCECGDPILDGDLLCCIEGKIYCRICADKHNNYFS